MRAGALRADVQEPAAVDPGDTAPTGADRVHVHHRKARWIAIELPFPGDERHAAFDQADVGGSTADIEGDDVGVAGQDRQMSRARDAGRRARGQGAHRIPAGLARRSDTSVRLQDLRRNDTERAGGGLEIGEVARHHRPQ